ncbi:TIGR04282 family arsenosugar biosynthesis glycosyltransferase [Pelotomaculum terephthalicicum JT]|uniref:TIGR04282 family arsenosugar biosynthesis glycosyltransferase n=1 Tax=Pelotomaculum terephthalicicum TaxID=206393 RepID=UPI001F04709E|nr:TIGR04282 family arsenosugar biosynthesis glycosyltransferase [Pelotomaculum terephthalicicum]MCG9966776.1 TIGR04282 family arsenosugar biosynthesis glycosyltransferase [Pelotomaculum terephthalicicum JT]
MARPALAVMARVPSAEGKSRLKELLKPEQREQLQWAFLLDTLDKIKRLPGFACFVAAAPAARAGKLKAAVGPEVEVLLQPGGDLGRRMLSVIRQLFQIGYSPTILIGADVPALPPASLLQAVKLLERYHLVFGPAMDGGYYLIGMRNPDDRVFQHIAWGTGSVLRDTLAVCDRHNLTRGLLGCLRDVDRPADLLALAEELKQMEKESVPVRTVKFLQKLLK